MPGAELATRWASQAFVEVTFVLAAHFAGQFPSLTARGEATARKMLREVKDPVVREKLTPKYSLGCKRPSFSNAYIPVFNRENVLLETTSIEAITDDGCSYERRGRASSRRARPCNRVQGVRLRELAGIRDAGRGWC